MLLTFILVLFLLIMAKLWERDLYLNPNIDFLIGKSIIEYDLKSAGYNLIRYFDLLPKSKIKYLEGLNKHMRHVQIGIYERADREFAKELTHSFARARELLFEANDLKEKDILSIKKDAIFLMGKCNKTQFGNLEFVEKNKYSSFHKFSSGGTNIEFYYLSSQDKLDVKGISDEKLALHMDYFMEFLKRVFYLLEINDNDGLIKFMQRFVRYYKNRELDIGFYREFSPDSSYTFDERFTGETHFNMGVDVVDDTDIQNINISYNYMRFLLPILQRYYFRGLRS